MYKLREEIGMVGNLNKSDLLNYANSYGRYMDLVKEVRKKDSSGGHCTEHVR